MPVTARLSKLFYDRLGEAVTNELVDWLPNRPPAAAGSASSRSRFALIRGSIRWTQRTSST